MIKLSLAVPCFNEQDNVIPFYEAVRAAFGGRGFSYEIVFVNDGSRDRTSERLAEIIAGGDGNVTAAEFSRNFGKEAAVLCALKHCTGEYTVVIDADLQQRPEVVLEMYDYLEAHPECDCVAAYQEKRRESLFMKICKSGFYNIVNRLSDTKFHPDASDFRMFRSNMRDAVIGLHEYQRFSKGIFSWVGFETHYIPYTVHERNAGTSAWNFRKLFRYAADGISAYTTAPLRFPLYAGGLFTAAGIAGLIISLFLNNIDDIRYTIILSVISVIGGIILISVGILGKYIADICIRGKERPVYIEKSCNTSRKEPDESDG